MSAAAAVTAPAQARQIKVWLGKHPFIDYIADGVAAADQYEAAMRRRFSACMVTNEPAQPTATGDRP